LFHAKTAIADRSDRSFFTKADKTQIDITIYHALHFEGDFKKHSLHQSVIGVTQNK
jgi:hypothetical protein